MIFLVRLNAVNQTLQKKSWLGDKDGGRKGRGVRSGAEAGVVSNYHFVYFITALTNGIQNYYFFPYQFRKQLKAKKAE